MYLVLFDANKEVADEFQKNFGNEPNVICENIFLEELLDSVYDVDDMELSVYAVASPSNSLLLFGGGIDGYYAQTFPGLNADSAKIRQSLPNKMLPVGQAVCIPVQHDTCKVLISCPTMINPGMSVPKENAYHAFSALLKMIDSTPNLKNRIVACPGFCTGVAGVSANESASEMYRAFCDFKLSHH